MAGGISAHDVFVTNCLCVSVSIPYIKPPCTLYWSFNFKLSLDCFQNLKQQQNNNNLSHILSLSGHVKFQSLKAFLYELHRSPSNHNLHHRCNLSNHEIRLFVCNAQVRFKFKVSFSRIPELNFILLFSFHLDFD